MKRGESMRSRGYTLIEIAGVMVVLGLLLGASLWPLDRQLRESEYRQERANMERLRDAVLGYALRHRTPGVGITMVDDDGMPVQTGFYAKGRPYLPCPDNNGDGIEDRKVLISPIVQMLSHSFSPSTPRRLGTQDEQQALQDFLDRVDRGEANILDAPLPPERLGFNGVDLNPANSPIRHSGTCRSDKRQLPWRTLGSIPADYWGNRYTYFADPIFSQEATGFDEKTVADSGDRRLPLVIDMTLDHIPQNRVRRNEGNQGSTQGIPSQPSVICDIAEAAEGDLDCGRDGTVAAPATLIVGEPAPSDARSFLNSESYFYDFPNASNRIADGLPFVIVSHGHNGFGAINHLLLRQGILVCRDFMEANAQERVNLYVYIPFSGEMDKCNIGDDGGRNSDPGVPSFSPSLERRLEGYFFAHRSDVSPARAASSFSDPPPPIPDRRGTDDLLVWMTRADLARRMREADVFPLILKDSDRPPVFFEPE